MRLTNPAEANKSKPRRRAGDGWVARIARLRGFECLPPGDQEAHKLGGSISASPAGWCEHPFPHQPSGGSLVRASFLAPALAGIRSYKDARRLSFPLPPAAASDGGDDASSARRVSELRACAAPRSRPRSATQRPFLRTGPRSPLSTG